MTSIGNSPPRSATNGAASLRLCRGSGRAETADFLLLYESQQPPLYYWILAPVQALAGDASIARRLFGMRMVNLLLTSLVIPLGFAAARLVLASDGAAVAVTALVAAMPGFVMTGSRVGNDGLAAAIFTALLWAILSADRPHGWKWTLLPGILLAAGLLTKAYFLTTLPALAVIYAWRFWRSSGERARVALNATATFACAAAISGWWYWRNFALTGSWSGLQQPVALRDVSFSDLLRRAPRVDWYGALDSTFLSYIYFGNWSFLQVRSWMYHFFGYAVLLASLGLLLLAWRGRAAFASSPRQHLFVLASVFGFFCAGISYHVLVTFAVHGLSSSAGWYLYALVVAEALLAALGLMALCPAGRRPWVIPAGTASFVLLDLYATHFVLIPYYTGFISHRPNGALGSFHLSQLGDGGWRAMIGHLSEGTFPAPAVLVSWLAYLTATFALLFLGARAGRSRLT